MKNVLVLAATLIATLFTTAAVAGEQYTKSGYAVDGYDTVAYFTEGKPVKGDESIEAEWNGAKWLFSTEEHKQLFLQNPEKYAPQYDGHCAWAAGAKNSKAKAVPEAWDIVNGKLYLNYSKGIQQRWLKDREGFIVEGDKNWPELAKQPAAKSGWF